MPVLKYRSVPNPNIQSRRFYNNDMIQEPYWEQTPEELAAQKPAASSVEAPTTDDIKPNNEPETVRKKRKRNLTIQPQDEGSGLAQILASIGLNIPT